MQVDLTGFYLAKELRFDVTTAMTGFNSVVFEVRISTLYGLGYMFAVIFLMEYI